MNTLGPYLLLENNEPTKWIYFKIAPDQTASVYTAPLDATNADCWQESTENKHYYVCDTSSKFFCYILDARGLLQVPVQILGNDLFVNPVMKVINTDDNLVFSLQRTRANKYGVNTTPLSIKSGVTLPTLEPLLPAQEQPTVLQNQVIQVTIDDAKEALQVQRFHIVNDEASCPMPLENHTLYLWKNANQWRFKLNFLDEIKTGELDPTLDEAISTYLNAQPVADESSSIPENIRLAFSRPYLKLTPSQQGEMVATMAYDWPQISHLNQIDQIQVYRSIITGELLSSTNHEIENEIHSFRGHLFLTNINNLYANKPNFTSSPAPTIASMILFTDYLLKAAAKALGDTEELIIPAPTSSSQVACGQLAGSSNQLLYQGLSESDSELFSLILSMEMQGLEHMPIDKIIQLSIQLQAIKNSSATTSDVVKDLLAAMAAQSNLSSEEAAIELNIICDYLLSDIKPIHLTYDTIIALFANETADVKNNIIERVFTSPLRKSLIMALNYINDKTILDNTNAKMIFDAMEMGIDPQSVADIISSLHYSKRPTAQVADALRILDKLGLSSLDNLNRLIQNPNASSTEKAIALIEKHASLFLTESDKQTYFHTIFNYQDPELIAQTIITLDKLKLLSPDNLTMLIQHPNANSWAKAIKLIEEYASLFINDSDKQTYFNTIFNYQQPELIAKSIISLDKLNLLSPDNLTMLIEYPNSSSRAKAIKLIEEYAPLFINDSNKQTYFNTIFKDPEPEHMALIVATLCDFGLLSLDNLTMLIQYHSGKAISLIKENRSLFLTESDKQTNFDTIFKHQDPDLIAQTIVTLDKLKLLSPDNLTMLTQHSNIYSWAKAIVLIEEHASLLLTETDKQTNFNTIFKHRDPELIAKSMIALDKLNLSSPDNLTSLIRHPNASSREKAIALIEKHASLFLSQSDKQTNFNTIFKHRDPELIAKTIITLDKLRLLSHDNLTTLVRHPNASRWEKAIQLIEEHASLFLTESDKQTNFDTIFKHQDPNLIAQTIVTLDKLKLLSPDNLTMVAQHSNVYSLAKAIVLIEEHASLFLTESDKQTNFDTIFKHQDPDLIAQTIVTLDKLKLLSPDNLTMVTQHSNVYSLAKAIVLIEEHASLFLTETDKQINLNTIFKHTNPELIAKTIITLDKLRLLSADNITMLIEHHDANEIKLIEEHKSLFLGLDQSDAQTNFNTIFKHPYPELVVDSWKILKKFNLLNDENLFVLIQHNNINSVVKAIKLINKERSNNETLTNFIDIFKHQDPYSLAVAMSSLRKKGLLTGDGAENNRQAITNHENPLSLATALVNLHEKDLLSGDGAEANRQAVANYEDPLALATALVDLNKEGLLTGDGAEANRQLIIKHKNNDVIYALSILHKAGLLMGNEANANRDILVSSKANASTLAKALVELNTARLLSDANRNVLVKHDSPSLAVEGLILLDKAHLLTSDNQIIMASHSKPFDLANALVCLEENGLYNFRETIITAQFPSLTESVYAILNKNKLLTDEVIDKLTPINKNDFPSLNRSICILDGLGLLTQENFDYITKNNHYFYSAEITILKENNLLNGAEAQANLNVIIRDEYTTNDLMNAVKALIYLKKANLLIPEEGQANRDVLSKHFCPCRVALALIELNKNHLLTGEEGETYRQLVIQVEDPIKKAKEIIQNRRNDSQSSMTPK